MPQARGESAERNEMSVERTSEREMVATRMFNGPARIVFDARTRPELLKRWWTPKSYGVSLFECESDLRVGGTYRYAFGRDPENPEVFSGRYIEVQPPSRLVFTQLYERKRSAGEAVVTVTFEESQGRTRLTLHQLFPRSHTHKGFRFAGECDSNSLKEFDHGSLRTDGV